ncbi:hypothetical protein BKA67DRAFT_379167 [Truncatella angustata]|uniref:CID domain-containing protein n=1 Tax=Truncatella angustata TaxID=152316 RepID=A0A9P8UFK5_9PEZI|nr:uncharacterized protein BKA67DRAFT_379167 [Truncatella angustata]KAH6649004.1 hypothetical protein BKA67DRAFT_379167 [Truncatella angustata]KAH8200772.1 hypothetical protein TruAng_005089 [Truncatella angustata]
MASPQLAIAKVSFSAVLLRPDPVSCPRIEIDEFLAQLDATLLRCSPANVQKSKQWILNRIVHSSPRTAALAKYLTALANSFNTDIAASRQAREPSAKRKRLHILHVLNDVLYHTCVRRGEDSFASQLESSLPALLQSAAAFANAPKHAKKISDLVNIWDEHKCFSSAVITKLQDTIRDAPTSDSVSAADGTTEGAAAGAKLSKDAPYIMPSMHGDANAPWYDLPAANWLPVIEPNSSRPMNPSMIKPLQFMPGPADKSLVEAVQSLLADVDRIYAKDYCLGENSGEDLDMLGQRVTVNESTGDVTGGETYYGWSRSFCDKMKQRRKKGNGHQVDGRGRSTSRSQSPSLSRSPSPPAFKRRRMSDSRSPSTSRSKSRSRRRSYSRDRSRRRSYTRSRSTSPRRDGRYPPSRSGSRSRSRDYSPPPPQPPPSHTYTQPDNGHRHQNYSAPAPPPPLPNMPPGTTFPFGVTPPPPPPNWQGPWPPPPPLPPTAGLNWIPGQGLPMPPVATGWGAPLSRAPPVTPFNGHQGFNQGGQRPHGPYGGRGDHRGGRGGYRGSRGGW